MRLPGAPNGGALYFFNSLLEVLSGASVRTPAFEATRMKTSPFPDSTEPRIEKGEGLSLLFDSLHRKVKRGQPLHRWSPAPLHEAMLTIRRDLTEGKLEVLPFTGGERGEVMVPAGDHLLVLHPSRPGMRAVQIRHKRITVWCSRIAGVGAGLLALSWIVIFGAFIGGVSLLVPSLFAAMAVVLFLTPLGLTLALTREPIPLSREYRLVDDVEMAIRDALTRGPSR